MPAETYSMIPGGSVRRIRTPHPHDVLSGRGGSINAHPGNKVFRLWVAERKEDYNLAPNKTEKTRVATEVMDRVSNQSPPGRFLARDPTTVSGVQWWIEIDEVRALAKTSQALREGAPQIRLAHKEELVERVQRSKKNAGKRKRRPTATAASNNNAPTTSSRRTIKRLNTDDYNQAMESLQANVREAKDLAEQQERTEESSQPRYGVQWVAPLTSNREFYQSEGKRQRLSDGGVAHVSPGSNFKTDNLVTVDGFADTPPLLAVPAPPSNNTMEPLSLPAPSEQDAFNQAVSSPAPSPKKLPRVHSLAFSDFSVSDTNGVFDEDGEFVNPFEDESAIAHKVLRSRQQRSDENGVDDLRNLSSNEDLPTTTPHTIERFHDSHPWEEPGQSDSFPSLIGDENDHVFHGAWETDFGEGMKPILDVVHPELTAPEKGEELPTLLIPYRRTSLSNRSNLGVETKQ